MSEILSTGAIDFTVSRMAARAGRSRTRCRITAEAAANMAVRHIRRTAPTTIMGVADALNWSVSKAKTAISAARDMGLLTRTGKTDRAQFIFSAVQTADWPAQDQP